MNRDATVEAYLTKRLDSLCRLDIYPDADRWTGEAHGWSPPVQHDGLFVFSFCPALVAKHADDLDDGELADYLRAITATVQLHIIHHDLPYHERCERVDDELLHLASGTLTLLSRVQMTALDRQGCGG